MNEIPKVNTPNVNTIPANMGPANTGPANMGPANTGPANTGPANMGPANMGTANMGTANMGLANMGTANISSIFTGTTFIYMLIFLAIYSIIYFILGIFMGGSVESGGPLRIIRIVDILIIILVIIYVTTKYAGLSIQAFNASLLDSLKSFKGFADNPYSIFTVMAFLIALYAVIFLVKIPMTSILKPITIMVLETATILLFVALLIIDFFKYILKIDLLALIFDYFMNDLKKPVSTTSPPEEKTPVSTCPGITTEPPGEVFNIRNNLYTYEEAREVCSVYGAKMATYDQVEKAYNDGGEWCSYGWSEGQMALFPTQKSTWDSLQSKDKCNTKKINNACGRPGINGGIIKNPNVRFGVNCYGKKPPPTESDNALMKANIERKVTESPKDAALHAKMELWKKNADKYLLVNSFNKQKWAQ